MVEIEEIRRRAGGVKRLAANAEPLRIGPDQRIFRLVNVAEDDPDATGAGELDQFIAIGGSLAAMLPPENHARREADCRACSR